MSERLPDRVHCSVTWWGGVRVTAREFHPHGATTFLPAGLAVDLERQGKVRITPALAPRPRRKGEVIHEPGDVDAPTRPVWLLDDLLDGLPALTVAPRSPRLPRYTTTPAGHASTARRTPAPKRHPRPTRPAARRPR